MTLVRSSSIDPINISDWRWQQFMDYTAYSLKQYDPIPCSISNQFIERRVISSFNKKPLNVIVQTWACSTEKLRLARAACLQSGENTSVINLVLIPSSKYDLPFFGADFVTLPSGHLIALDFQPVLSNDIDHLRFFLDKLTPIYDSWNQALPYGGEIPEEAKKYFSPCFLWSRLPLKKESDQLIEKRLKPAFDQYLNLYMDLVERAEIVSQARSKLLFSGQVDYLEYRAKKDPARGMLSRFFGKEWTESYIQKVLFSF